MTSKLNQQTKELDVIPNHVNLSKMIFESYAHTGLFILKHMKVLKQNTAQ